MNTDPKQTTPRRLSNARRLLESAGWAVLPPVSRPRKPMADQCEYPGQAGASGDCCMNMTRRLRQNVPGNNVVVLKTFRGNRERAFPGGSRMPTDPKQTTGTHPRFTEHPETVAGDVSRDFMTLVLKVHPDQPYTSAQAALMCRYAYDLGRKEGKANAG